MNHQYAYAWSGHILVPRSKDLGKQDENIIPIDDAAFDQIMFDFNTGTTDKRITVRILGPLTGPFNMIGTGVGFRVVLGYFGSVYDRARGISYLKREYSRAMRDHYRLWLPMPRTMFGCSSDR